MDALNEEIIKFSKLDSDKSILFTHLGYLLLNLDVALDVYYYIMVSGIQRFKT